jgi:hypothetical protein
LDWGTAAAPQRLRAPLAHDPEKCKRFSDEIMRKNKDVERDPFRWD